MIMENDRHAFRCNAFGCCVPVHSVHLWLCEESERRRDYEKHHFTSFRTNEKKNEEAKMKKKKTAGKIGQDI